MSSKLERGVLQWLDNRVSEVSMGFGFDANDTRPVLAKLLPDGEAYRLRWRTHKLYACLDLECARKCCERYNTASIRYGPGGRGQANHRILDGEVDQSLERPPDAM
jgi:hypothetical protein